VSAANTRFIPKDYFFRPCLQSNHLLSPRTLAFVFPFATPKTLVRAKFPWPFGVLINKHFSAQLACKGSAWLFVATCFEFEDWLANSISVTTSFTATISFSSRDR
jgi:hypothetical protein